MLARPSALVVVVVAALVACSGSDDAAQSTVPPEPDESSEADVVRTPAPDVPAPQFVRDVRIAIDAVEDELGGPQEFFEVTSNSQFTNVFVAVDDATAALPYVYIDGELQPSGPKKTGAAGATFTSADVEFVDDRILSTVTADLPESGIDAISVYGDGFGAVYVLGATSRAGGVLDIVVGPDGTIFSVDPR